MRIRPQSGLFTLLLGIMAALPTAGIDIVLPSLPATGSALDAPVTHLGLTMSAYLLGLGAGVPLSGSLSDRIGRKPVLVAGCLLLALASLGCMLAPSFGLLLLFRLLQGAGASGPTVASLTMVQDLFDREQARARMAGIVMAINVLPMAAPSLGAVLLTYGGWRAIYGVPLAGALGLLAATPFLNESRPVAPVAAGKLAEIARSYGAILGTPSCRGYILCNAASAGAVFAYITGSPLYLIEAAGMGARQYGFVFGVSSLSVMIGAAVGKRLGERGFSPDEAVAIGLALSGVLAATLLLSTLAGWTPVALVAAVMAGVALSFGLISPNALESAMRPHPDKAGAAGAAALCAQMGGAAVSSDLVARFFDRHSPLSMAATMLAFCLLAILAYRGAVRPAERRRPSPDPASLRLKHMEKRS
jgi:MFS transporter, DHA1 family, multidrug resistance protein